jgi:HEPN domain
MRKRKSPSRADVDAAIQSANDLLAKRGVPIPRRPERVHYMIEQQLKCNILLFDEVYNRIFSWFKERYGDRAKSDIVIGRSLVKIGGDLFSVTFPWLGRPPGPEYWPGPLVPLNRYAWRIRESFELGAMKERQEHNRQHNVTDSNDPLMWIDGITTSFIDAIQPRKQMRLRFGLLDVWRMFDTMCTLPRNWLADMDAAVDHLIREDRQCGLSRWASLQAAEKTLKGYIRALRGNPPRTHDLQSLANQAQRLGLSLLAPSLISRAQCSPSVRYDEPVTLKQAIDAHLASLHICFHISLHIKD